MSDYFPTDFDYSSQSDSDFLKMENDGDSILFRILGHPIVGYVGWVTKEDDPAKHVPVRAKTSEEIWKNPRLVTVGKYKNYKPVKGFMAWKVLDRETGMVKVFDCDKPSILDMIGKVALSKHYSIPDVDFLIERYRDMAKNQTAYSVNTPPPKPLTDAEKDAIANTPCDLSAMFRGEYPLASGGPSGQPKAPAIPAATASKPVLDDDVPF